MQITSLTPLPKFLLFIFLAVAIGCAVVAMRRKFEKKHAADEAKSTDKKD